MIENMFNGGVSFSNIFTGTPLCWLNIDQIYLIPNYSDSFLWGGLTPDYSPSRCPNGQPYGAVDKELLHPKELIKQVANNILLDLKTNLQDLNVAILENLETLFLFDDQYTDFESNQ